MDGRLPARLSVLGDERVEKGGAASTIPSDGRMQ